MAKLRTAPAAREDIRGIRAYSKTTFGAPIGREYLDGLIGAFDRLEMRPLTGIAERDLGEGVRSVRYRSHRIDYRIDADEILVIRVLHHARDIGAAFAGTY